MDGVLIIDKPKGITSHDVVDFIRKKFEIKKAGHAGTLDPSATGILVVLLGKSTKESIIFTNHDKEYLATMVFGAITDTYDADGKVIFKEDNFDVELEEFRKVLNKFIGEIEQTPPMVSAVKYKGRKLYEFARKGIDIPRKPRKVCIKNIEIIKFDGTSATIKVCCSKGTYVRSLCKDIGDVLGCGAYLSALRRIRSGNFNEGDAYHLDKIKKSSKEQLQGLICK